MGWGQDQSWTGARRGWHRSMGRLGCCAGWWARTTSALRYLCKPTCQPPHFKSQRKGKDLSNVGDIVVIDATLQHGDLCHGADVERRAALSIASGLVRNLSIGTAKCPLHTRIEIARPSSFAGIVPRGEVEGAVAAGLDAVSVAGSGDLEETQSVRFVAHRSFLASVRTAASGARSADDPDILRTRVLERDRTRGLSRDECSSKEQWKKCNRHKRKG